LESINNSVATSSTALKPKTGAMQFNYDTIPSRVKSSVSLKIATSNIPGAGRGMFVLGDVAAGDVIFTIPRPLLLMVHALLFLWHLDKGSHFHTGRLEDKRQVH
jgi:hypothetical protein